MTKTCIVIAIKKSVSNIWKWDGADVIVADSDETGCCKVDHCDQS